MQNNVLPLIGRIAPLFEIKTQLGLERKMTFEEGLAETVRWYIGHSQWVNNILNGSYKDWISKNYTEQGR